MITPDHLIRASVLVMLLLVCDGLQLPEPQVVPIWRFPKGGRDHLAARPGDLPIELPDKNPGELAPHILCRPEAKHYGVKKDQRLGRSTLCRMLVTRRYGCIILTASDKFVSHCGAKTEHHDPCPGPAAHVLCGCSATLDLGAHCARRT